MTFDDTVSIPAIITLGVAVAGGIAAWVTLRMTVAQLKTDFAAHRKHVAAEFDEYGQTVDHYRTEMSTTLGAINAKLELHHVEVMRTLGNNERALMEFKLHVATNFAGNTALEKVEARLGVQLKDIANRIDEMSPRIRQPS